MQQYVFEKNNNVATRRAVLNKIKILQKIFSKKKDF